MKSFKQKIVLFIIAPLILFIADSDALRAESEVQEPSKIASSVQQLVDKITASAGARAARIAPSALSNDLLHVDAGGRIELLFHAAGTIGGAEEKALESLGAEIVTKLESPGMIQAWVPYDKVDEAASLPWVVAVTPPGYGHADVGSVESEGVQLHRADDAQNQSVDGTGVNVGAISDGVSNLAAAQASGDLPNTVTVLDAGFGDEGTAMLEIIHDMAPGAALVFHATGATVLTHVNALNTLVVNGVNVITEDWAFDDQPAFQQGIAATTAEQIATNGVAVHSSAGNQALRHAARVPAVGTGQGPDGNTGPFTDCGGTSPTNAVDLNPDPNVVDTTFDVRLGATNSFTLQWSEPRNIFPTVGAGGFTNLDLYIMDAAGTTCLGRSTSVQGNGAGDTIEQVAVNAAVGTQAKIVVNYAGNQGAQAAPLIDLRWRGTQAAIDATVRDGSLNPDSNYIGLATSAAAVDAVSGAIEGFSSGGPVYLGLTTICPNNTYPCAGSSIPGPGVSTSPGPNWAAADGGLISGAGGFGRGICPPVNPGDQCRFFGTSAAAPHAAACDALARQIFGAATAVAAINARLANNAVDILPAGIDNVTGAGQLDCFAALEPPVARCQDKTVPTDAGICTASNVSVDDGSFDPSGGPVTLTQAPPNPYPLGTTSVTLTATDQDNLFASCSALVTVQDQEPPVLGNVPAPIQVEQTNLAGTPVTVPLPTATDNCTANVTITSDAPAVFPLGTTTVTFTATDQAGNISQAQTTVTVVDTTPPAITSVNTNPSSLWPPNHKMVPVVVAVSVTDICDAAPGCRIVSVSSNEPENGLGDGDTAPDWEITGDLTLDLRAERSGTGSGRVYTITVQCTDASGNYATKDVTVTVPHNR